MPPSIDEGIANGSCQLEDTHRCLNRNDLPWTATRCRRLLRPLQARLVALRKHVASTPSNPATILHDYGYPPIVTTKSNKRKAGEDVHGNIHTKKLKRTYSQKRTSSGEDSDSVDKCLHGMKRHSKALKPSCSTKPGVPAIATPVLRKVRKFFPQSTTTPTTAVVQLSGTRVSAHQRSARGSDALTLALENLQARSSTIHGGLYKILAGLLRDLDILLQATTVACASTPSRSLVSMCLRKVPRYAAEADVWEMHEAKQKGQETLFRPSNPCARVYDDLERLGVTGNGWKHLPVLVRAHALLMLQEAVSDRSLEPFFVGILVKLYDDSACLDNARDLLEVLITREYPSPRSARSTFKEAAALEALLVLSDFVERHSPSPRMSCLLSSMLKRGLLPHEWLVTKAMEWFWTYVTTTILQKDFSTWDLELARVAIMHLSAVVAKQQESRPMNGLTPSVLMLQSVVGAITAMAWVVTEQGGSCNGSLDLERSDHLRERVICVLQTSVSSSSEQQAGHAHSSYLLQLGSLILGSPRGACTDNTGAMTRSTFRAVWANPSNIAQLHELTTTFACSVAHISGRLTRSPSSHYFAALCDLFDNSNVPELRRIRKDGAFRLAQRTDDLRDLVFAEGLSRRTATPRKRPLPVGLSDSNSFYGYRWEEGISEWIVVSPEPRSKSSMANINARPTTRLSPAGQSAREDASNLAGASNSRPTCTQSHISVRARSVEARKLPLQTPIKTLSPSPRTLEQGERGMKGGDRDRMVTRTVVRSYEGSWTKPLSSNLAQRENDTKNNNDKLYGHARPLARNAIRPRRSEGRKALAVLNVASSLGGESEDELGV